MVLQVRTRTVGDVMTRVKRQFGDESGVQITNDDLIRWINDGQLEIATQNRILRAKATTPTVAGQNTYTLPDINVIEIDSIHYGPAKLQYRSFPEVEEEIFENDPAGTAEGAPKIWYEYGGQITLWPTPDAYHTEPLTVFFVKAPDPISTESDLLSLPDKYFGSLCDYVIAQAYEMDEDWDASSNKLQQVGTSLASMNEEETQGQQATYPVITVYDY